MKVVYDAETDTLSVILREVPVAESDEIADGIIADYDGEGGIVSLEVLEASKRVADPKGMVYEIKSEKRAS